LSSPTSVSRTCHTHALLGLLHRLWHIRPTEPCRAPEEDTAAHVHTQQLPPAAAPVVSPCSHTHSHTPLRASALGDRAMHIYTHAQCRFSGGSLGSGLPAITASFPLNPSCQHTGAQSMEEGGRAQVTLARQLQASGAVRHAHTCEQIHTHERTACGPQAPPQLGNMPRPLCAKRRARERGACQAEGKSPAR